MLSNYVLRLKKIINVIGRSSASSECFELLLRYEMKLLEIENEPYNKDTHVFAFKDKESNYVKFKDTKQLFNYLIEKGNVFYISEYEFDETMSGGATHE